MDIWGGDPWIDESKNEGTAKKELKELKGTSFLAGFEDEAGWGDFEGDVGEEGWKKETEEEETAKEVAETSELREPAFAPEIQSPGWNRSPIASFAPKSPSTSVALTSPPRSPLLEDIEEVPSHQDFEAQAQQSTRSDITIIGEERKEEDDGVSVESPASPNISTGEGEKSIQPSLSSSEASNFGDSKTPDSLRTSFDDSFPESGNWKREDTAREAIIPLSQLEEVVESKDDDFGDFESDFAEENSFQSLPEISSSLYDKTMPGSDQRTSLNQDIGIGANENTLPESTLRPKFQYDLSLVNKLFERQSPSRSMRDSGDEVISSASTRRAWYRITRPQTLREFNEGSADDNYVRISWPRSNVKQEVLKVVSRWASEDRVHGKVTLGGTLPAGGAAFGWDEPPSNTLHNQKRRNSGKKPEGLSAHESGRQSPTALRQRSSKRRPSTVSTTTTKEIDSVAQFSWSTSPVTADPASQPSVFSMDDQLDSLFGPPKPQEIKTTIPRRASRSASVALKSGVTPSHHRSTTVVDANVMTSSVIAQGPMNTTAIVSEPTIVPSTNSLNSAESTSLSARLPSQEASPSPLTIDTSKSTLNTNLDDEDDEWGEMMQSPPPPLTPIQQASEILSDSLPPVEPALRRPKKPTPILPSFLKQASFVPGQLSPARKAAFEAARVTRTLSSQQTNGSPSGEHTSVPSRQSAELDFPDVDTSSSAIIPLSSPSSHTILPPTDNPFSNSTPPPTRDPLLDADFSIFDAPSTDSSNTGASSVPNTKGMEPSAPLPSNFLDASPAAQNPPQLTLSFSNEENNAIQRVVRGIPDLTYMLR
jgi:hypothetical protein